MVHVILVVTSNRMLGRRAETLQEKTVELEFPVLFVCSKKPDKALLLLHFFFEIINHMIYFKERWKLSN